jgi:hypothetical protein
MDQPAPTISLSDAPKIALPKNLAQTLQFLSDVDLETLQVSVDSELKRRPQQRFREAGAGSSILELRFLREGQA